MDMSDSLTRMEMQERIDDLYAHGEITHEEWSKQFDELSSNKWTAKGKVCEITQKENR
jgi:polyhydroxyalkanoate synthesis regulator phasin